MGMWYIILIQCYNGSNAALISFSYWNKEGTNAAFEDGKCYISDVKALVYRAFNYIAG